MQLFRTLVQIAFLTIFISLMILGKAQFWMAFIFISIILAIFWGRFYCGWACPIHTLMTPVNLLSRKLGLQRSTPSVLKKGTWRLSVFLVFLIGLGYTIYTITLGKKFPLPLIIIPFGLLVTLFINPTAWHRYLCPWGTFFSLTGRFTSRGIKALSCAGCQRCKQSCPTDSISYVLNRASINPTNCLLCFRCSTSCKTRSLQYGSTVKKTKSTGCHT